MTRKADMAHRAPTVSTWLTREPLTARPLPVRTDPDYDSPDPAFSWRELLTAVPAAVVVILGVGAAWVLLYAFTAPVPG